MADIFQEYSFLLKSFDFYILLALVLLVIYQLFFYFRMLFACRPMVTDASPTAGVSVIVCARNEQQNLQDFLHALLTQDYPCFEVIVVDDGSEDDTSAFLERSAREWSNMYHTFVPRGARVISSKKLALTIGIKAAHYDYILLTDADCRPESKYWIREMMSGFVDESTELVLGFSPYFENNSFLSNIISYDTLFVGLQYMALAKAGHPYMGVGRNMAYRKELFFAHNGFQGLLNERAGDDDLFVNKVATRHNTAVVCTRDSLVWSVPERYWHNWFQQKRRHLSVSSHYKLSSKLRIGAEPFSRGWIYILLIVAMACCGGYAKCIALALFLLRMLVQYCVINLAAKRLGLRYFGIEIVFYDIFLPLFNLYILLTNRLRRKPIYW